MQLKEFIETTVVEGTRGNLEQPITGLSYDSRAVKKGNVFFAVPGGRVDGHDFARQALERGAAAVVLERDMILPADATSVRVSNVRRTMGDWAALFYAHPSRTMVTVGVTGTNGKTTVTYLLESIFTAAGLVSGVIGTINYRHRGQTFPAPHTTPESPELQALLREMADARVQGVAMEVSSHALALERVRGIDFDGAIFTNLTRDHLDFHGDMESYFLTKCRLFTDYLPSSHKRRKFAVIHGDDPRGRQLLERARQSGLEVVSYGQGAEWDVRPVTFKSDVEGLRGEISFRDQRFAFSSRLIGKANLENILAAAGVGLCLGLAPNAILEGIARLDAVPGRLERIENDRNISVLVDYAHTPDALERVLEALSALAPGRLIVAFGCGGDRDRGKRPLMGEIAARVADIVVLTSDNPRSEEPLSILREIERGVENAGLKKFQTPDVKSVASGPDSRNAESEKGYYLEPDRQAAIRLAISIAGSGDVLLIAGKGHEDYQIVGSNRLHFDDREVARKELQPKH